MKLEYIFRTFLAVVVCLVGYSVVNAQDAGQTTAVYFTNSGSKLVVSSGGEMDVLSGGAVKASGTAIPVEVLKQQFVAYSPVLAATPAAPTNIFKLGLNVIPTHAANTAGLMPTPAAAGERLFVVSNASNTVRLKPGSTNTVNGGSAGAYLPIATGGTADCLSVSTSAWSCELGVMPTPQGP